MCLALTLVASSLSVAAAHEATQASATSDAYLTWSAQQAEAVGKSTYQRGRVGGVFDTRLLKTERAYNYKLAATWLTPDVIRATARLHQLRSRLTDAETRAMVAEAEAVAGTVVMVEIDPREGSGVIPNEWDAILQSNERPSQAVRGIVRPELRDLKGLAGVLQRNYDYDRFWVTFPLTGEDGAALFGDADRTARLIVRIGSKEGRVEWPVPQSLRGTRGTR